MFVKTHVCRQTFFLTLVIFFAASELLAQAAKNPVTNSSCGKMGGELGWDTWQSEQGYHQYGLPAPTFFTPTPPVAPRFFLTSGLGVDSCTPGGGGPPLQHVCPGFGNASIRLGEPNANGIGASGTTCTNSSPYPPAGAGAAGNGCSERLTYSLPVTVQDTNFVYAYAIVLENPIGGHDAFSAPFAEIYMLDQNGDTVSCSHRKYISDLSGGVGPGFYAAACTGSTMLGYPPNGMDVSYKPWISVGVNLSAYVGQTLTVVLTNSDCALGGHYCVSYWDFLCGSIPLNTGCSGSQSTVCAPASDPSNPYAYQWYLNGNIMPGQINSCVAVTQNPGDTYLVNVMPANGCDFYMSYLAGPASLQALFTYSPNGSVITFTDLSVGASQWNYDFGDGTTSTLQNPVHTYTAPGTYNACLVAGNGGACTDTVCKKITISPTAVAESEFASAVSVFPSPATKIVYLDFGRNNFGKAEVLFSNLIGEILFSSRIPASGKQAIDVSGFAEGIYFLKLKTDHGSVTKKIMISN